MEKTMIRHVQRTVFAVVAVWVLAHPASAQTTTAAGPYYAVPSWDQTLPVATRFVVLSNMASKAVLDRETGLVWERAPGTFFPFFGAQDTWRNALELCRQMTLGDRKGWRLPTIEELASLVTAAGTLPAGHPFQNIAAGDFSTYWSATLVALSTQFAYVQALAGLGAQGSTDVGIANPYICVRGGVGVSAFTK
jgi:hypothetical protein